MISRLIAAWPLERYQLWLTYADGTEGAGYKLIGSGRVGSAGDGSGHRIHERELRKIRHIEANGRWRGRERMSQLGSGSALEDESVTHRRCSIDR